MQRLNLKNKYGFTLVELLVVVAILGILASIVSFGVAGQQRKARDAQRKSDLKTVKTALESGKLDCQGGAFYPKGVNGASMSTDKNAFSLQLIPYLTDPDLGYLKRTISDPKNDATTYFYRYKTNSAVNTPPQAPGVCSDPSTPPLKGQYQGSPNFVLRAQLEITADPEAASSKTRCQSKIDTMTWNSPGDDPLPSANTPGMYYVCNN